MALFEKAIVIDVGTHAIKGVSYKFAMGELEILECHYQNLSEFEVGAELERLESEAPTQAVEDDEPSPAVQSAAVAPPHAADELDESDLEFDDDVIAEDGVERAEGAAPRKASLLARIIGRFVEAHWSIENTFVINLTGQHLLIRDIVVPFHDARKVLDILPFELENQISLPLERVIVETSLWGTKPEGGATALTFCALREHVQERSEWFLDEQLPLKTVTADPVTLSRLVTDRLPASENLSGQLDIGGRVSVFNLIFKGELVFTRTLHVGGENFTHVIAEIAKLELPAAEDLKRALAIDVLDFAANDNESLYKNNKLTGPKLKKIFSSFSELVDEIAQEIEVSVLACPVKADLETIYISGGGSRLGGLPVYLARALSSERRSVEAASYSPPAGFPEPATYDVFANAMGMVYHQVYNRSRPVDFLKGEMRAALKGRKDLRLLFGPGLMFASSIAMALFGFICDLRGTSRAAAAAQDELCDTYVKAFQPSVSAKEKDKACGEDPLYKAKQQMKSASIGVDVAKTVPLVQVLDALKMISEAMPDSATGWEFNNLEIKSKETLITGIVADSAAVVKVKEALLAKGLFELVEVAKKSPAGKISAAKVMATYKIVFKKPGKN